MSKFFIDRPIVAMVIAILMVIVGSVSMLTLPVAQFPTIVPPEIQVKAHLSRRGRADFGAIRRHAARRTNQRRRQHELHVFGEREQRPDHDHVDFDVKTDPNIDQVLTQLRTSQAQPQFPAQVTTAGLVVQKSLSAPLMLVALYSPNGTYDNTFLANYAYINLMDELTRVPGIARVQVFGAGQYAMRCWVKPDQLAKLAVTVPQIIQALQTQNNVNPAGQSRRRAGSAGPAVHLHRARAGPSDDSPEQFGEIILRANPDGSTLRLKDVARLELGAQTYSLFGPLQRQARRRCWRSISFPDRTPWTRPNALRARIEELSKRFPQDLEYTVSLDTTAAVTAGMKEIVYTLFEALRAGGAGGVHFPAGLARDADPAAGRAGFADRNVRRLSAARIFHQHAFAIRIGAGDRTGGGRRDRRGGSRRASYRRRHDSARRRAESRWRRFPVRWSPSR